MEYTVHTSTLGDIPNLVPLFDAYRIFYEQASSLEAAKQYLTERMSKNEAIVFHVTNKQGAFVGFCLLYPFWSSISMQRIWVLNDLYVNHDHRKHGVAHILMSRADAYAVETNAKEVILETHPSNTPAKNLYKKFGYKLDVEYEHWNKQYPPKS